MKNVDIDSLPNHSSFTTSTSLTFSAAGSNYIWTDLSVTITGPTSHAATYTVTSSVSATSYTFAGYSWTTHVFEVVTPYTSTLTAGASFSLTPTITCSTTGQLITYWLDIYGTEAIPTWVSFDDTSGTISGTAPIPVVNTTYSFYVATTWVTTPPGSSKQLVQLTVPQVTTGSSSPVTTTEQIQLVDTTTSAAYGVVGASVASAAVSGGSPVSLWAVVHQLQMIILILLA